jgi:hypothetical protein
LTLADLVAAALRQYEFRGPRPDEQPTQYLAALIDHVETRDYAAAHELRVGKPQAEWSPAEVEDFRARMLASPGPLRQFDDERGPAVHAYVMATFTGRFPVSDAEVRKHATLGVESMLAMRRERPTHNLAIFANVLLLTGEIKTLTVGRRDRIALLKQLARDLPVYGFWLVADMFIHAIGDGRANKRDAIIAQVGTRTMRLMLVRPYAVVDGFGVRVDPPMDVEPEQMTHGEDPYAEIFVSVPAPKGAPS